MLLTTNNLVEIASRIKEFVQNDIALISVAEHTEIDINDLITELNKVDIRFIGGIFPMIIYNNDVSKKGIVVHRLYHVIHLSTIQNISKKNFSVSPIEFKNDTAYSLITYVDGLTSNISHFLSKLYENYGMKTNYFGGGTGSLTLKQSPCIFSKEGFFQDAAVVCLMEMKSNIGVKHGWQKLDGPFIVTKAKNNVVEEINWENPYEIYKKIVEEDAGIKFSDTSFFNLANGYPLGIIKQGVDYIIRDPLSVKNDKSLICIGEVEENTMINIMKGDNSLLIKAAKDATVEIVSQATNPKNAIIIDCISRILYLKDEFKYELESVSHTIQNKFPNVSVCGALTLGEISSYGNGYIEFYNKTIVVGLFE
ncbi:FIST signal transduction protein [Tenacibaculum sp. TC6]|uniref:FIST signal transduction protein n=1 Tax=Tenacibaculum sp. TC6 TaxID=3423223 RepID=UPI003D36AF05